MTLRRRPRLSAAGLCSGFRPTGGEERRYGPCPGPRASLRGSTTIGLTGGLGTGKSTVLKFFGSLGAKTWNADEVVRRELGANAALKRKIRNAFGEACLRDGRLDKKKLAAEVFSSPGKVARLERLIHPIVKKKLAAFLRRNKKSGVAVAEVPLLFETDFYKLFDVTACVVASPAVRRKRLLRSHRFTPQDIARRVRHQMPLSRKSARCDMIIHNNGTKSQTYMQVKKIMEEETWKS
ncbi:MAG: dephospho-CoA kinase [Candidatus Velamenicoccus archaeovorus]